MDSISNELQLRRKTQDDFLRLIVGGSWIVLAIAVLFQLILFWDVANLVAIVAVILAWLLATRIWFQPHMLNTYLISSFIIIGFVSTQFYLPLLFTSLEGKPLIYNLELPEEVFLHSTLALLVCTLAHGVYRLLMKATPSSSLSFLEKAGFFTPPTHLQLWIMGFVGIASSFYVYFVSPDVGREVTGESSDKLVQALVSFTYAPFFLPFARLYGSDEKPMRGAIPLLVVYGIALLAISMGRNSRGAFIIGLTNPIFAYIIGLMLAVFSTRIFTLKNLAIAGLVVWFLTGPLSDLGTAMLIVRGDRTDIPPAELVVRTLEAFGDKQAIEDRKRSDITEVVDMDWDEHYLDNIYTARFSNIKFNDSNLITYNRVGEFDPDMQRYSFDVLLAILPDPVLKFFELDVDKETVLSVSFGDYLYVLSGGVGNPEGFRVGHFAGSGMAAFGWWYLLIFGVILIPIFFLNDLFFKPGKLAGNTKSKLPFQLSFCAVLLLTSYFQFLWMESVIQGISYLIRSWIQVVLLYFLVFQLSRRIALILTPKRKRMRMSTTQHEV